MNKYLLSISGGADSVYLFYHLLEANIDFDLIHFNHNTRGNDNIDEENYCRNLAQKFNKKIFVFNYIHKDGNFQNEARNFRINKIVDCVKENQYNGVYLAHHKDDQVENIIMNKTKVGSKIMSDESYQFDVLFIRPLLNVYKQEIYDYLKRNQINFYEDYSNKELKYFRNRIRYQIKELTNEEKDEIINKETARYNKANEIRKKKISINELSSDVDLYKYLSFNGFYKNYKFIEMVMSSLEANGNKEYTLDDKHKLYLNYGYLSIGESHYNSEDKKILTEGLNIFNNFKFNNEYKGMYVRSFRSDDRFGNKKISRYFIDNKIYKQYRPLWPIIVDEKDQIIHIIKLEELL